jgi:hypothetical protein
MYASRVYRVWFTSPIPSLPTVNIPVKTVMPASGAGKRAAPVVYVRSASGKSRPPKTRELDYCIVQQEIEAPYP